MYAAKRTNYDLDIFSTSNFHEQSGLVSSDTIKDRKNINCRNYC
jgi:hypothetical protein